MAIRCSITTEEETILRKVFNEDGVFTENEIRKDLTLINDLLNIQVRYSTGSKRKLGNEMEKRIHRDMEI